MSPVAEPCAAEASGGGIWAKMNRPDLLFSCVGAFFCGISQSRITQIQHLEHLARLRLKPRALEGDHVGGGLLGLDDVMQRVDHTGLFA